MARVAKTFIRLSVEELKAKARKLMADGRLPDGTLHPEWCSDVPKEGLHAPWEPGGPATRSSKKYGEEK